MRAPSADLFFCSMAFNGFAATDSLGLGIIPNKQYVAPDKSQAGDYIKFGSYEQDNRIFNGKEPIEWLVLKKEENRILVISKYTLDCRPYNESWENVTWETCALRAWLNDDFLNAAFAEEERACIPTVVVPAARNPDYDTDPGRSTEDKIFLLSIEEHNTYLGSGSEWICQPTAFAVASGVCTKDNGRCWWWLRTSGESPRTAANASGVVNSLGHAITVDSFAVRPAMWISFES